MNTSAHVTTHDAHHEHHHHHDMSPTAVFGFWMYIMTDCVLFATLFAMYAVVHNNFFGGASLKELISLPYVLGETAFLLLSNLTFGFGILTMYRKSQRRWLLFWLGLTFLLGLGFVTMEVREFIHLYMEGHGPQASAAMSAFFVLVGTHGTHVSFGLLWIFIMMFQILFFNVSDTIRRRLTYLGLFWNFLDIVWIFVFTIVYLMGVI